MSHSQLKKSGWRALLIAWYFQTITTHHLSLDEPMRSLKYTFQFYMKKKSTSIAKHHRLGSPQGGFWNRDEHLVESAFIYFFYFNFIYFFLFLNFTILYWFCRISKWIHHRYTCVPHPELSSLLPPHTIPLGHPSALAPSIQYRASNLDWRLVSYMILYMFHGLEE